MRVIKVVFLCFMVLFSACSSESENTSNSVDLDSSESSEKIFIGQNYEYTFNYPEDWTYDEDQASVYQNSTEMGIYLLPSPNGISIREEENMTPNASNQDFTDTKIQEDFIEEFQQVWILSGSTLGYEDMSFEIIDQDVNQEGFPFYYILARENDEPIFMNVIIFSPSKAYVFDFAYNQEPNLNDELFQDLDFVFNSFQLYELPSGVLRYNEVEQVVLLIPEDWSIDERELDLYSDTMMVPLPHPEGSTLLIGAVSHPEKSSEETLEIMSATSLSFHQEDLGFVIGEELHLQCCLDSSIPQLKIYTQVYNVDDRIFLDFFIPTDVLIYWLRFEIDRQTVDFAQAYVDVKGVLKTFQFTYYDEWNVLLVP